MRPILFRWRRLTVWSYPAMLYFGLVLGVVTGNLAAHAAGINPFRAYVATMLLIVPALLGARLLYVSVNWRLYKLNLRAIWDSSRGGYILYGGLPAMLLLSIPLLAVLRLNFGAFWDTASFTILVGMIFTRIGCLMNGCCAGRPSGWWLTAYLPNSRGVWEKRIPTQVLEAAWAAILLLSAIVIWRRMRYPGALFLFVVAGYSVGRFLMEFTRERRPGDHILALGHFMSLFSLISSFSMLTIYWQR